MAELSLFSRYSKRNIEDLLYEANSVKKLREYALQLYTKGFSKEEIYQIFLNCTTSTMEQTHRDNLEDVMDMITGWYVGKNIDFRNEIKGL